MHPLPLARHHRVGSTRVFGSLAGHEPQRGAREEQQGGSLGTAQATNYGPGAGAPQSVWAHPTTVRLHPAGDHEHLDISGETAPKRGPPAGRDLQQPGGRPRSVPAENPGGGAPLQPMDGHRPGWEAPRLGQVDRLETPIDYAGIIHSPGDLAYSKSNRRMAVPPRMASRSAAEMSGR